MTTFKDLWLAQKFLDVLDAEWYHTPTPIQEQSIPVALEGKDIFGCAQTGTGKTASFSLPMLQLLDSTHDDSDGRKDRVWIRSLIITPTRELAIQIGENLRKYSRKTNLRTTVIYGGVKQGNQVKILRKWVEILVATPGRLLDLVNQKHINLTRVEVLILDEADRMMDMWFIHDIKKINNHIPKKRQTLFFSATTTDKVMDLAGEFLTDPVQITVSPASSTVDTIDQSLYTLSKQDKKELLYHIFNTKKITSAVVFTRTKHWANKVEKNLKKVWIKAAALHGNKSQNARQKALNALKTGEVQVLVATDVAARGIDIDMLSHVIIYDVPVEPESYVHRIGRTGRAGETGEALMFCEPGEIKYLKEVTKLIKKDIPLTEDQPFHLDFGTLTREQIAEASKKPARGWRGGRQWGGWGRWWDRNRWWGSNPRWGRTRSKSKTSSGDKGGEKWWDNSKFGLRPSSGSSSSKPKNKSKRFGSGGKSGGRQRRD